MPKTLGRITFESAQQLDGARVQQFNPPRELLQKGSEMRQGFLAAIIDSKQTDRLVWDLSNATKTEAKVDTNDIEALSQWLNKAIAQYSPWLRFHLEPTPQAMAKTSPELLDPLLELPIQPQTPRRQGNFGWDSLVDPWVDQIPTFGNKIPSAYRIWQSSRRYLTAGDHERARRSEELNYLLHNSHVPAKLQIRGEVIFAYGGIGVILHPDADIHPGVTIGANVTVGGSGSQQRVDERTGSLTTVPKIGEFATIGACANVSGGIEVGALSIIAPNSVVTKSVEPGQIVAGAPARPIGKVTKETALRYKVKYLPARALRDDEFQGIATRLLQDANQ